MIATLASTRRCSRRNRGVSLVEALVALAVMGFGMLGLVGMQSSLRTSSDISKQRSHALRIAQETIETWRGFVQLGVNPGQVDYADIEPGGPSEVVSEDTNATYQLTTKVSDLESNPQAPELGKVVEVEVSWVDRTGTSQKVVLATVIGKVLPELRASLAVGADGTPVRQPFGRNRGIPPGARDLLDGRSVFSPPGTFAPGGNTPNPIWTFDNVTGLITFCYSDAASVELVAATNLTCTANTARLLTGYIRYALGASQPTDADAADAASVYPDSMATDPGLTVTLVVTAPSAAEVACFTKDETGLLPPYTVYFCAVPVTGAAATWTGSVRIGPETKVLKPDGSTTADRVSAAKLRICRYVLDGAAEGTAGIYTDVKTSLGNRNFLAIRAGSGTAAFTCPTGPAARTLPHQPAT